MTNPPIDRVDEMRQIADTWRRMAVRFRVVHYLLSFLGVACPVIAAILVQTEHLLLAQVTSGVTAVATGVLAFVRPFDKSKRFRAAWGTLWPAYLYNCEKAGRGNEAAFRRIIAAYEEAEFGVAASDSSSESKARREALLASSDGDLPA